MPTAPVTPTPQAEEPWSSSQQTSDPISAVTGGASIDGDTPPPPVVTPPQPIDATKVVHAGVTTTAAEVKLSGRVKAAPAPPLKPAVIAAHEVRAATAATHDGGVSPTTAPPAPPLEETSEVNPSLAAAGVEGAGVLAPFTQAQLQQFADLAGSSVQPPEYLVNDYKAAAEQYKIPWSVLAAINYVETGYGRDLAVSSAGAVGWMQFMPSTWAEFGEVVNRAGKVQHRPASLFDAWDASDAIFSAARMLVADGARQDIAQAVFDYNHATWYVDEVLELADKIKAAANPAQTSTHPSLTVRSTSP